MECAIDERFPWIFGRDFWLLTMQVKAAVRTLHGCFRVSLGMVKKLIQQRRHTGDIAPRHHRAGRKPMIVAEHQRQMRSLLGKKPDLTLKELRNAMTLECSLQAIHVVPAHRAA